MTPLDSSANSMSSHIPSTNNTKHSLPDSDNTLSDSMPNQPEDDFTLPLKLRTELHCAYNVSKYDLQDVVTRILLDDADIIALGKIRNDDNLHPLARLHLLPSFQSKVRGRPKEANRRWRLRGISGDYSVDLRCLWGRFVEEVIKPIVGAAANEELVFQSMPILRIQTPSMTPLGNRHRDEVYGRQPTEINVWLPLVDVAGNNSLWVESARDRGDFHPLNLKYGQFARFWGSQCEHFTKANTTNVTRVSLDFRVILKRFYVDNYVSPFTSNPKSKFFIGGAYTTTERERQWRRQQHCKSKDSL